MEAVLVDAEKVGVEEILALGGLFSCQGLDEKTSPTIGRFANNGSSFGELGREFVASCSSKIRYK